MSRILSPDELDLEPEVLTDEDMAVWVASIESSPDAIRDEIDQLTAAPRRALATSHDKPFVTTSRSISKTTMATLKRRGLVKRHGTTWRLTNFGRNVGQYLAQEKTRINGGGSPVLPA